MPKQIWTMRAIQGHRIPFKKKPAGRPRGGHTSSGEEHVAFRWSLEPGSSSDHSDLTGDDEWTKGASRCGNAFSLIFETPGKPSRKSMDSSKKGALAMVRYDLRLKLARDPNDELLNAPIPDKGTEYVAVYREEKLRALLQKYKIDPSSRNAYYLLSLQLATNFHPGFNATPPQRSKRPQWSGTAGKLLIFFIEKIRRHSKTQRSTTSLIRELKRQHPRLYGSYSDQTLKVRYFEARRQLVAVR